MKIISGNLDLENFSDKTRSNFMSLQKKELYKEYYFESDAPSDFLLAFANYICFINPIFLYAVKYHLNEKKMNLSVEDINYDVLTFSSFLPRKFFLKIYASKLYSLDKIVSIAVFKKSIFNKRSGIYFRWFSPLFDFKSILVFHEMFNKFLTDNLLNFNYDTFLLDFISCKNNSHSSSLYWQNKRNLADKNSFIKRRVETENYYRVTSEITHDNFNNFKESFSSELIPKFIYFLYIYTSIINDKFLSNPAIGMNTDLSIFKNKYASINHSTVNFFLLPQLNYNFEVDDIHKLTAEYFNSIKNLVNSDEFTVFDFSGDKEILEPRFTFSYSVFDVRPQTFISTLNNDGHFSVVFAENKFYLSFRSANASMCERFISQMKFMFSKMNINSHFNEIEENCY